MTEIFFQELSKILHDVLDEHRKRQDERLGIVLYCVCVLLCLCRVVLCRVVLCLVCFVALRYVTLCSVALCRVALSRIALCCVVSHCGVSCCVFIHYHFRYICNPW